jgi:tetrapyrrole methylase family protein/MazG family protein
VTIVGSQNQKVALARMDWSAYAYDHLTSLVVAPLGSHKIGYNFNDLIDIMARLRHPQTGCPWDLEQSPETLRRFLIEESYELLEAIDGDDPEKYAQELGDVLLQVVFHAQLARESDEFTVSDVLTHLCSKLIRRHPHVFAGLEVASSDEVLQNWEAIKSREPEHEHRKSLFDGVPRQLPALMRAQEISRRAAKAGFEWDTIDGVFEKLDEEIRELKSAIASGNGEHVADEIGDLIFTAVNLARFEKIEAEDALQRMASRFVKRFARIEAEAESRGLSVTQIPQQEKERLWQLAKRELEE